MDAGRRSGDVAAIVGHAAAPPARPHHDEEDPPVPQSHPPAPELVGLRSDPGRLARYNAGRALRDRVPRESHANWASAHDRPDPVGLLEEQATTRIPDLVRIRYGRMSASPFAFYRGAALVMAADLSTTPSTGRKVQLAGDAHVANFGLYASPERDLLFDVNDFDETLPGPWEWDVKRLAASVVVASRSLGHRRSDGLTAARAAVGTYRTITRRLAGLRTLDLWYARIDEAEIASVARGPAARMFKAVVAHALDHDSLHALATTTDGPTGDPRIVDDPPLIQHRPDLVDVDRLQGRLVRYRGTLESDRRELLRRYRLVDVAIKVVGVGSVGTHCYVALLLAGPGDPLFLQVKEAQASVLERFVGKSRLRSHGERVVAGQRIVQAASDAFLGWGYDVDGRDYYWRQLRDWKGSFDVTAMRAVDLLEYARLCGAALARAHARSGDPVEVTGYLGSSDAFDRAIASFAEAYADQTERDLASLRAAVKSGRITAEMGV